MQNINPQAIQSLLRNLQARQNGVAPIQQLPNNMNDAPQFQQLPNNLNDAPQMQFAMQQQVNPNMYVTPIAPNQNLQGGNLNLNSLNYDRVQRGLLPLSNEQYINLYNNLRQLQQGQQNGQV